MLTLIVVGSLGIVIGLLASWLWHRWSLRRRLLAQLGEWQRTFPAVAPLQRPPLTAFSLESFLAQVNEALQFLAREHSQTAARQAQLAALFDQSSDGIVLIDPEGTVLSLNRAARLLLAGVRENPVGRPYGEVLRDYELNDLVARVLEGASPLGRFVELGRPRRTVQAEASLLQGPDRPLVALILRDITELRRTETIRRDFVANVSHDLRTPIAALRALVETLLDGALADPMVAQDFLRRIATEVDHLARLVDQLLELTKAESGQLQLARVPTDLVELARATLRRFEPRAATRGIVFALEAAPDLPPVPCDPDRIGQVLANLLDNALKFTPPGGRVTVEIAADDERAIVRVRDTGPGIPADELDRVFERFFKGDRARTTTGSGLGLAIVKHLVQLHGGTVWAESPPGSGAIVGFTLPRERKSTATK